MSNYKGFSVINQSLWKAATGEVSNPSIMGTNSGFGMIEISLDYSKFTPEVNSAIGYDFPVVRGVLQDEFTYSMESTWDSIKTPFDGVLGDTVNDISVALGGGAIGAAFTSKLYWRNSGFIKISPKFRVYDYDGSGAAMLAAYIMNYYVLSTANTTDDSKIGDMIKKASDKAEEIHNNSYTIKDGDKKRQKTDDELTSIDKVRKLAYKSGKTLMDSAADLFTLHQAPPTAVVNIGNFFKRGDMVVTDVSFTYSDEYSYAGPLYVDISVSMISRTIITSLDDAGIVESAGGTVSII